MCDKYHHEWVYNDFATQLRILRAQVRSFDFMKQLAEDIDEVSVTLKDIYTHQGLLLRISMNYDEIYYYKIANGIGRNWLEVK